MSAQIYKNRDMEKGINKDPLKSGFKKTNFSSSCNHQIFERSFECLRIFFISNQDIIKTVKHC
jgi:hypothetical protein